MGEKIIGVVAAMPDEIRPLLRRAGKYRKGDIGGCLSYEFRMGENLITLVQSGMGPLRAREATEALIRQARPALVVNLGFAGAVREETRTGDLVLAREVLLLSGDTFTSHPLPEREGAAQLLAAASLSFPLHEGVFVTSATVQDKKRVAALLPPQMRHPVLEMETAAVVDAAREAGVPVLALRGVSDGADEEFGFSLEEFCDSELKIRPGRVLATVARKPWIIPQLMRLAADSRRAAERLADCLEILLRG